MLDDELHWRGYLNQMLYNAPIRRRVDDHMVAAFTEDVLRQIHYRHPADRYYQAAVSGLESGRDLAFQEYQDEASIRDFLGRFVLEMDARRPWPSPTFDTLDDNAFPVLAEVPVVGLLKMTEMDVQNSLHRVFGDVPVEKGGGRGLVLKLRTGQIVALHSVRTGSPATPVRILSGDDPDRTMSNFRELTGLEVDRDDR